jgi:2-amino-4-hydroxy-6-hydroxymethyldihydropteridine diphosphokinase
VETKFNPNEVLLITQEIEKDLGRTEKTQNSGYQSRTIDIDIIFFNHEVLDTPKLTIPHALFRERRFVLEPLNDLANQYVDPISYLTVEQLLRNCSDKSKLTILENQFLNTL